LGAASPTLAARPPHPVVVARHRFDNLVAQRERVHPNVIVHVPKSSNGTTPLALVLTFTGAAALPSNKRIHKMNATANEYDFIVAYPQALIPTEQVSTGTYPASRSSRPRGPCRQSANDVKFLTSLVGIMESKYCVKTTGVYATGSRAERE